MSGLGSNTRRPSVKPGMASNLPIRRDRASFDYLLAAMAVCLAAFGVLIIYSATGDGELGFASARNQIIFAVAGVGVMLGAAFFDYEKICRLFLFIYGLNLLLLVVVLVWGAVNKYDVSRSIDIRIGSFDFGILPSEFSKIFMIIFSAKLFDVLDERIHKFRYVLMILGLILLPVVLIAMEPSLSACMVTLFICVAQLFVAKLKLRYFVIAIIIMIPLAFIVYYDVNAFIADSEPIIMDKISEYQLERLSEFFFPQPGSENAFQLEQSVLGISSGQLTGVGLFGDTVNVPYNSNDFVFALIAAEFGFAGCVILLAFMLLLVLRCLYIAAKSETRLGKLIAAGTAAMLFFQVFVNTGVATGLLPVTGMSLPFISAGGSSLWVCFAAVGLVLNVGMSKRKALFGDLAPGTHR